MTNMIISRKFYFKLNTDLSYFAYTAKLSTIELTIGKWLSVVHTIPYCCTFYSSNSSNPIADK